MPMKQPEKADSQQNFWWISDQDKIPATLEDTLIGKAQAKFEEFKDCLNDKARTLNTDVTGIMGDMADNINSLLDEGLIGEAQRQMQEYVECSSGKVFDMVEDIDGYMDDLTTEHNEKLQEMKNRAWQLSGEEKEGVLAQMDALVKEYNAKMGNLESWRQILLGNLPGVPVGPVLPVTGGQHGLDMMVNRPSLFLAGEAGPEHVRITPGGAVEKPTIVIYGPLLEVAGSVDRATAEYVIREMERLLRNVQIYGSSGFASSTHKRIQLGSTIK